MIQTLANAFEIIYSPIVLMYYQLKKSGLKKVLIGLVLAVLLIYSLIGYLDQPPVSEKYPAVGRQYGNTTFILTVDRNMQAKTDFQIDTLDDPYPGVRITIFKPLNLDGFIPELLRELHTSNDLQNLTRTDIETAMSLSDQKVELIFRIENLTGRNFKIEKTADFRYLLEVNRKNFPQYRDELLDQIHSIPALRGITPKNLDRLHSQASSRSFFLLFVVSLVLIGLFIIAISLKGNTGPASPQHDSPSRKTLAPFLFPIGILIMWVLPGLSSLGRIISSIIYLSVMSLFIIDKSDARKFADHGKFLLMIFLYSGFWILYFQMFDSVLWYVQAYVDAASLNSVVNRLLGALGIHINWFFDVEHVTVINAGTIIILQLIISNIVKKKNALPTMITGIGIGTVGMAILAISTNIWIFMSGIVLFSIGEMTAHPKFISYIGLVAPAKNKAMYMGYLFLYGVFGSSIGGIVGAKLYVYFVDNLNQPRVLWLIFSSIGVVTIICLLLYNKFLAPRKG